MGCVFFFLSNKKPQKTSTNLDKPQKNTCHAKTWQTKRKRPIHCLTSITQSKARSLSSDFSDQHFDLLGWFEFFFWSLFVQLVTQQAGQKKQVNWDKSEATSTKCRFDKKPCPMWRAFRAPNVSSWKRDLRVPRRTGMAWPGAITNNCKAHKPREKRHLKHFNWSVCVLLETVWELHTEIGQCFLWDQRIVSLQVCS